MLQLFSPQAVPIVNPSTADIGIQIPPEVVQQDAPTWDLLCLPLMGIWGQIPPLIASGNRKFEFTFEQQLYSLIYFHVEEYRSARALIEDLNDPQLPGVPGLPHGRIKRSTFSDAINTRGLAQALEVFHRLSQKAAKVVGSKHPELGRLIAFDGSLIEATLSMVWADYTQATKKAKVHLGFDLQSEIPTKIHLTHGKGALDPLHPINSKLAKRG